MAPNSSRVKDKVDGLVYAGVQTVLLANNHADNGGAEAFMDMIHTLHDRQISTCGRGGNGGSSPASHSGREGHEGHEDCVVGLQ